MFKPFDDTEDVVVRGTEKKSIQAMIGHLQKHLEALEEGERPQICAIVLRQVEPDSGEVNGSSAVHCGEEMMKKTIEHLKS